jgi:ABC-type multidrug transport system ATPase subunit
MKQRIKLGIALFDDRPLLLLDEPTSNLDEQGKQWFATVIGTLPQAPTLIIASNDPEEIRLCPEQIDLNTAG